MVEHYYIQSCISSCLCKKVSVKAQQSNSPGQLVHGCARRSWSQQEYRQRSELQWCGGRGSGGMGQGCHHFPWGAIQLLQENIQLCIEFNKPDETAGPSPSCNLASETCNIPLRPLWISGTHPAHSFWATVELSPPSAHHYPRV